MLAAEWHARLVVLHVLEQPEPVSDLPSWRRPSDPLHAARQRVLNDLRDVEGIDLEIMVERGNPATVILDVAQRLDCELVMTGVARDETLGRILLGTTVEALTRQASAPVLVVKSRPRAAYRNVVAATDFSDGSRQAFETALALFPQAQITLFHAFSVPFEGHMSDQMAARERRKREVIAESQAFLDGTPAVKAAGRTIPILAEYGAPGALLQDLALAGGVDLVVMGTRGRSGLARMLVGSVAHDLLRLLPVDALLVRQRRD